MTEKKPDPKLKFKQKIALSGCGTIVLIVIVVFALNIFSEYKQRTSPSFDSSLEGTTVSYWTRQEFESNKDRISWFRDLWLSSSSFSSNSSYENVFQYAEVYPDHKLDDIYTWRPYHENQGLEWLTVRRTGSIKARGVVVVESFHPGVITAVDDIIEANSSPSPTGKIVRLWSGNTEPAGQSRVMVFHLAEPRYIEGIRVILDTSLVNGWNCIDAIGLLLAD